METRSEKEVHVSEIVDNYTNYVKHLFDFLVTRLDKHISEGYDLEERDIFGVSLYDYIENLLVLSGYVSYEEILNRKPDETRTCDKSLVRILSILPKSDTLTVVLHPVSTSKILANLEIYLEQGKDINSLDVLGDSMLARAASLQLEDVCKVLLDKGASYSVEGEFRHTTIFSLFEYLPDSAIVSELVKSGCINTLPLEERFNLLYTYIAVDGELSNTTSNKIKLDEYLDNVELQWLSDGKEELFRLFWWGGGLLLYTLFHKLDKNGLKYVRNEQNETLIEYGKRTVGESIILGDERMDLVVKLLSTGK